MYLQTCTCRRPCDKARKFMFVNLSLYTYGMATEYICVWTYTCTATAELGDPFLWTFTYRSTYYRSRKWACVHTCARLFVCRITRATRFHHTAGLITLTFVLRMGFHTFFKARTSLSKDWITMEKGHATTNFYIWKVSKGRMIKLLACCFLQLKSLMAKKSQRTGTREMT